MSKKRKFDEEEKMEDDDCNKGNDEPPKKKQRISLDLRDLTDHLSMNLYIIFLIEHENIKICMYIFI